MDLIRVLRVESAYVKQGVGGCVSPLARYGRCAHSMILWQLAFRYHFLRGVRNDAGVKERTDISIRLESAFPLCIAYRISSIHFL